MLYSRQLTSCRGRTMNSNTFEKFPCCVGVRSGVFELHGHSFSLWQRRNTSVVGFTLSELVFLPQEQKTRSRVCGSSAFMQINCNLGYHNQKMKVNVYEHTSPIVKSTAWVHMFLTVLPSFTLLYSVTNCLIVQVHVKIQGDSSYFMDLHALLWG
jgi:hypothetical protein